MWSDDVLPIRIEKLRLALESAAERGVAALAATARSGLVKFSLDCRTAIATPAGELAALGRPGLGHMGTCLVATLAKFGRDIAPGDIYATNDPFSGGSHLPDIWMGRPVFWDGELIAFALASAHMVDIGGMVPGSMTVDAVETYQEGLRLPPLRLYRHDEPDESVLSIIECNVRGAEQVLGDITGEVAALHEMEREILQIARRFDRPASYGEAVGALLDASETAARAALRDMPDGVGTWVETLDYDSGDGTPLMIKVRMEKIGDELRIDFTGTSRQAPRAINSTWSATCGYTSHILHVAAGTDLPDNQATFRPVSLHAELGTLVNPSAPAAVGARAVVLLPTTNALLGALSQIVPDRVAAGAPSLEAALTFSGRGPDGALFVHTEQMTGSSGASAVGDGIEGSSGSLMGGTSNVPVEVVETEMPALRVEHFRLVPDTGGPGLHRGGLSVERGYRALVDDMTVYVRGVRDTDAPYGLVGGRSGRPPPRYVLRRSGEREPVAARGSVRLQAGDVLVYGTSGAGGHGPAEQRAPADAADDLDSGKVTVAHLVAAYDAQPGELGSAEDERCST